jgi:hypothetical protein
MMVLKVTDLPLREYLAHGWGRLSYKPHVKRAVLEMGNIFAAAEAKRESIPYTPLYWNEITPGKWLYSLWEIK